MNSITICVSLLLSRLCERKNAASITTASDKMSTNSITTKRHSQTAIRPTWVRLCSPFTYVQAYNCGQFLISPGCLHFSRLYHPLIRVSFTETDSLNDMLDKLVRIVQHRHLIPLHGLDALLGRFATEEYSSKQALSLIGTCCAARYHTNHAAIMTKAWQALTRRKSLLAKEHYLVMMNFYSESGDANEVASLFGEFVGNGFAPSSCVILLGFSIWFESTLMHYDFMIS